MAARTFSEVWGRVALQVPSAPHTLVQAWVQDAYDDLVGTRHWAWLRKESVLSTLAQRSITVTFAQGSTAITSAALFVATDAGRQIRVGSATPIYTINTVTDASNAVLTEAYAGTGGAQTAAIHDRYIVMPADFRSMHSIVDMTIQRPIAWWISRERLDLFDPGRINSDSRLRVLSSFTLSVATATLGRVMYEAWPSPTAAGSYALHYFKRGDVIADDDAFSGVLATKVEVLINGALARAAMWPGTHEKPNPYFDLKLATMLEGKFMEARQTLDVMDDDQYLMDLSQTDLSEYGLASLAADTTLLRQNDSTIGDYFGG